MLNNTMKSLKNKKSSKKGFTLMEMLIVVAIIAILVAIAIPTFNNSLNKARLATDQANARALKAIVVANYLDDNSNTGEFALDVSSGTAVEKNSTSAYKCQSSTYKDTVITCSIDSKGAVTMTPAGIIK